MSKSVLYIYDVYSSLTLHLRFDSFYSLSLSASLSDIASRFIKTNQIWRVERQHTHTHQLWIYRYSFGSLSLCLPLPPISLCWKIRSRRLGGNNDAMMNVMDSNCCTVYVCLFVQNALCSSIHVCSFRLFFVLPFQRHENIQTMFDFIKHSKTGSK